MNVYDTISEEVFAENFGEFMMYTDFYYYSIMKDQKDFLKQEKLISQEEVAYENKMKVSQQTLKDFRNNHYGPSKDQERMAEKKRQNN